LLSILSGEEIDGQEEWSTGDQRRTCNVKFKREEMRWNFFRLDFLSGINVVIGIIIIFFISFFLDSAYLFPP
jgi:hypothetical protein